MPPAAVDVPPKVSLRELLRNRRLFRWLLGSTLCDLLDELFVAFAALYLAHQLHASPEARGIALAGLTVGGLLGLTVLDRLLHRGVPATTLLRVATLGCVAAFAAWMAAPTLLLSGLALVALGACIAPQWPLAEARAYAALPGRADLVQVLASAFGPLGLVMPLAVGLIADQVGLTAALCALLVQPVALFLLARDDG